MCGLAGYYLSDDLNLSIDPDQVLKALAHRGPDSSGSFVDYRFPRVGVFHSRLAIVDLNFRSSQPMFDRLQRYVICFNGEIYNHISLRKTLESAHIEFRGSSDTEVLLEAYIYFVELRNEPVAKFLSRLNGIYAFSIYDKKTKVMFLARDYFGVKPLYYHKSLQGFFFGSEVPIIRTLTDHSLEANVNAVIASACYLWNPSNKSHLDAVSKVAPGEFLFVEDGRITRQGRMDAYFSDVDCPSSFTVSNGLETLQSAISNQLTGDVEIGCLLSGGVDSSLIVALANRVGRQLPCFTLKPDEDRTEFLADYEAALEVSSLLNVPLTAVPINEEIFMDTWLELLQVSCDPILDPAEIGAYLLCREASNQSIKVVMSGVGGDDLFSGYRRHSLIGGRMSPLRWPRWLYLMGRGLVDALPSSRMTGRRIDKLFMSDGKNHFERLADLFLWMPSEQLRKSLAETRDLLVLETLQKIFLDELVKNSQSVSSIQNFLNLERRFFLGEHNLLYLDKVSMLSSVEARVPFLDLGLVNFARCLPDELLVQGLKRKIFLKDVARQLLPAQIVDRKKVGFGSPIESYLPRHLESVCKEFDLINVIDNFGLISSHWFEDQTRRIRAGEHDLIYSIFAIMNTHIWLSRQ